MSNDKTAMPGDADEFGVKMAEADASAKTSKGKTEARRKVEEKGEPMDDAVKPSRTAPAQYDTDDEQPAQYDN